MKYYSYILAAFIVFAATSCGGVGKYAADYDDIYYSNKKQREMVAKNTADADKRTNEEVVMKAYSRENSESGFYTAKNDYPAPDSLAGELDDQVVYISNEDNVYDNTYTSSNVYAYLQGKETDSYETSYEDRINRFSNDNVYGNISSNWNSSFYPMIGLMFGSSPYRNPYTRLGYMNPYYYSGFYNPYYAYNQSFFDPYYYSDPYFGYNSYRYNPYAHYYGGGNSYYNSYYSKKNLQRTRRQRVKSSSANKSASSYGSYYRRNGSGHNYKSGNVGNRRNTAQRSKTSNKGFRYENKTGHRRSSSSYRNRAKSGSSTSVFNSRSSSSSSSSRSRSSSYSGIGSSRSSSSSGTSRSSSYSGSSRSSSSSSSSRSSSGRRRR